MFDPGSLTLSQLSSSLKDFTIVGFLLGLAWKARGFYELASNFFARITKHMDTMESGMHSLLSNHIAHMEEDLRLMSGRRAEYDIVAEEVDPLLEK